MPVAVCKHGQASRDDEEHADGDEGQTKPEPDQSLAGYEPIQDVLPLVRLLDAISMGSRLGHRSR